MRSGAQDVRRVVGVGILFLVLAIGWSQFAPPSLGGRTTFLVVQGSSMLPRFHAGDLVAVRSAAHYPIGSLAAYEYVPFHAIYFHQIVGRQGSHYVFKGINNRFVDGPFEPTREQIIGRFWLDLPGVGRWLTFWHQPVHAALLVAGLTLVLVLSNPRRRRKVGAPNRDAFQPKGTSVSRTLLGSGILATLAVAGTAFSLWSYAKPLYTTVSDSLAYRQSGRFSYSAAVPKSVVYPQGVVPNGGPIYSPPASTVSLSFGYRMTVPQGQVIGGTARLDAELVSTSGWQQTWTIVPMKHFRGGRATLVGTVDVSSLYNTVAEIEKITHDQSDSYRLVLLPSVNTSALADGRLINARFAPHLSFTVQPTWLQLDVPSSSTADRYLNPSADGTVQHVTSLPASIRLGGMTVPLATARVAGPVFTLAAALCSGLLIGFARRRERRLSEAARIAQHYGGLLVDVDSLPFSPTERSIRVGSMAGLVRLAEQCERMILHAHREGQHVYLLENVGESYYFTTPEDATDEPVSEPRPTIVGPESVASQ